ncbi:MAG TPA: AarF/UbiB family protein, partial [Gillisia sp.]|nr:AarF/UbiB family protein [Gillisia sp.]
LEETDYILEVKQSKSISEACTHIPNLKFPKYYEDLSSEKIITMDWMEGEHLSEFAKKNKDQAKADKVGQTLWDFYMYQMHHLKELHADPHPGNFLIDSEENLIAIDFGCIKQVPDDFYVPYFELAIKENINNPEFFSKKLYQLEILRKDDSQKEITFFSELFYEMLSLFTSPFHKETFDFSDETFWSKITELGEKYSKDSNLRKMNGNRGSKHFLYINRTFFGLYNMLHDLKAKVEINNFKNYI